jgi:hypothetical protein
MLGHAEKISTTTEAELTTVNNLPEYGILIIQVELFAVSDEKL